MLDNPKSQQESLGGFGSSKLLNKKKWYKAKAKVYILCKWKSSIICALRTAQKDVL